MLFQDCILIKIYKFIFNLYYSVIKKERYNRICVYVYWKQSEQLGNNLHSVGEASLLSYYRTRLLNLYIFFENALNKHDYRF